MVLEYILIDVVEALGSGLMIEAGRHKKIDLEERICKTCSQNRTENERHFLLECPAYIKIRKSLLKHVDPNEDNLNN